MGETAQIVALWRRCRAAGEPVALATVVHVEGSSYRKPGARMLVAGTGERAGTVSGGCLEAEISRKVWWLTAQGPRVEQYQSSFDEDMLDAGAVPWGLGCGGTVWILMERDPSAVLQALAASIEESCPAVIVAVLDQAALEQKVGTRAVLRPGDGAAPRAAHGTSSSPALERVSADESLPVLPPALETAAARAMAGQATLALDADFSGTIKRPTYFVEYLAPAPRLSIFGAGDDAQPIAAFAEALGWRVVVADGRSHLLRRERFPAAAELRVLRYTGADAPLACIPGASVLRTASGTATPRTGSAGHAGPPPSACISGDPISSRTPDLPAAASIIQITDTGTGPGDLAVILTHSFEQDRALLAALLPQPLAYLGILGPRHRTLRLLSEAAPGLGWSVDECFSRLRAPVGLDLGARDPASIALAIVAEMQATLTGRQVSVTRAAQREQATTPEKRRA